MHSLRVKILGLSAIILFFTGFIVFFSLRNSDALKKRDEKRFLSILMLNARFSEANFLLTRKYTHIEEAQAALVRFDSINSRNPGMFSLRLKVAVSQYRDALNQLAAKLEERGLNENLGAEGRLRETVHQVEEAVKKTGRGALMIDMLQARRAEKDFFLRNRREYVEKVEAAVSSFLSKDSDPVSRELMRAYLDNFREMVRLNREVDSLRQRLSFCANTADRLVGTLVREEERKADQSFLLMLTAIVSSVFAAVYVSFLLSRVISRPLTLLQAAADNAASGQFSSFRPVHARGEIGSLSRSFSIMLEKVQKGIQELQQKTAEAEEAAKTAVLTRNEALALINNTGSFIWSVDADYNFVTVNSVFVNVLKARYGDKPLYGNSFFSFVDERHREFFLSSFSRALRGESFREERTTDFAGDFEFVEIAFNPILSETGKIIGVAVFVSDITERIRFERALIDAKIKAETANIAKSHFLAKMNHEMRTPLNGILSISEFIVEEAKDEEFRQYGTLIRQSGERLFNTIGAVLDLVRIESGKAGIHAQQRNVLSIVKENIQMLMPEARRKNISLTLLNAPGEEEILFMVDEKVLNQVLSNVAGNAVKFTSQGGVRVLVRRENPEELVITVSDDGIGMSEEFINTRLFKRFEQESRGHSRDYEGSGLGLYITRSLLENTGGKIEISSKKGVGTTVILTFRDDFHKLQP
jgi:PAS domain S-box-containing protein